MTNPQRRVVLDRPFAAALQALLEAFAGQGFTIQPVDGGDLHEQTRPGVPLRYARLQALLPELTFGTARRESHVLGCEVSLFELAGCCTLVTIDGPMLHYPLLASLLPRMHVRINAAMAVLRRKGAECAA
jgi:hypothetical protein